MSDGVHVVDSPLAQVRLSAMREESTNTADFTRNLQELASIVFQEAAKGLETKRTRIRTPLAATSGTALKNRVVLVPILRAGAGMLDGIRPWVPDSTVGFLGMARNEETHEAEVYLDRVPDKLGRAEVFILDPMLATGGSALSAIGFVRAKGARNITLVHLLASPEGIARVREKEPDIPIFTASIDKKLTPNAFIYPGLGDAGDRQFGT